MWEDEGKGRFGRGTPYLRCELSRQTVVWNYFYDSPSKFSAILVRDGLVS